MSTTQTAPTSPERQKSLFERAERNDPNGRSDEGRETGAGEPQMFVPKHRKRHILHERIPSAQRRAFARWRQAEANREWQRYVDRRLPTCSVDGYKDVPHRKQSLHGYGVDQARKKGWGDAIRQKKASLRKKWRLAEWRDIRVRSY